MCSRLENVLHLALLRTIDVKTEEPQGGCRKRLTAARAACCGHQRRRTGIRSLGAGGGGWGSEGWGGLVSAGTGAGRAGHS